MFRPFLCIALAFALGSLSALASPEAVIAEMDKIQNESATRTASIGLCFIPLSGEPSDADGYRIDTALIPASTMKAITTATANEILSPDFKFQTRLETAGVIDEEGTLVGNLVIKGGGDPTLAESGISSTFARWKTAMQNAGIKKIAGSIVGDASIFGTKRVSDSWPWNDFGNYYGSGPCGLTFHQNQFFASFSTPSVGGKAPLIGTDPKLPGVKFFNEMRVGSSGSGDNGYIYGSPYGQIFYLRGTVPDRSGSFTIRGALPDPAFFCARAFTKYLSSGGFEVTHEPSTVRLMSDAGESLAARKIIHEQESGTLKEIMYSTNMKSVNLRAECIFRMIGHEVKGKGTINASADAIRDHWSAKGVDMTGSYIDDGAGLSRANLVTPRQMAEILYHAAKHEDFDAFKYTLPVAGQSGTLRSIGGGSSASGRVRAKSGTIGRVRNYAGYIDARSGEKYAFAIFMTNYSGDLGTIKSQIVRVWSKMVAM
ncbi:MAG: D-alanyl-D-alanine carboxypeptidase/D-alanyl-D-alanine-endopeptidase [Verrucomicrobiales bacterium]|nr:D-alanyl-D-alanine carboxypeptidase/D-alanyl-D-alanine-endopeptidase [Verrucomicrobiales bacterium]